MRKVFVYVIIVSIAIVGCKRNSTATKSDVKPDSMALLITQINRCSRLYTAEAHVRKILTSEDSKHFTGTVLSHKINVDLPFSSRKIAIPVDATVKAYVDFSDFSKKNIIKRGDNIEIILPDPHIILTSSRIDHGGVKTHVSLMRSNYSDAELTAIDQCARNEIIREIPRIGIIDMSRVGAANVIIPLVKLTGYRQENIKVTFRKKFYNSDLSSLVDKSSIEESHGAE